MSTFEILQALVWVTLAGAALLLLRAELQAHRQHLLSARGLAEQNAAAGHHSDGHRDRWWDRVRQAAKEHGDRAVAVLLKVEIVIAVSVALVLFVLWSSHQHAEFGQRSNTVLCGWLQGNC